MKRTILRLIAGLALLATLGASGPCGAQPVTPDGGLPRDPTDKTLVLQVWTYQAEPIKFRLSVHNQDGKPLVGDKGQDLGNYEESVVTSFAGMPNGYPAVWEVGFDYKASIRGTIKIEARRNVTVGCRLYLVPPLVKGKEQKARVELVHQQQKGRGPRFTCEFVGS